MKKFLPFFFAWVLPMLLPTPAASQSAPISNLPTSAAVQSQDNVILNQTNSGLGTFTTKRTTVQAVGNFTTQNSNQWAGNVGQFFPGSLWHSSVFLTQTNLGTFTLPGPTGILTSSAGAMAGWPGIGCQFNEPVGGGAQYWIHFTNNAQTATVGPRGAGGFTNQNITVQFPQEIYYDSTPGGHNVVAYIAEDGTIGSATGTFGLNGNVGGGFRLEDGFASMQMKMQGGGGIFGEDWILTSDTNNYGPILLVAYNAPVYSFAILPDGTADFEHPLTNDTGPLVVGSALTVNGNQTNLGTLGAAGNFGIGGNEVIAGTSKITGQLTLGGGILDTGDVHINGTTFTTGPVSASNNVSANGLGLGNFGPQFQLIPNTAYGVSSTFLGVAQSGDGLPAGSFFLYNQNLNMKPFTEDYSTGVMTFNKATINTTIATTATTHGAITSSGWTNSTGTNCTVYAQTASLSNWVLSNGAGAFLTNTSMSGFFTFNFKPGDSISETSGSFSTAASQWVVF